MCVDASEEKFTDCLSPLRQFFLTGLLIGLVAWWVPIWHCWWAIVSNHISSLIFCKIRETDQPGQKVYLSQVASAQIISNQCLCQDFRFNARSLTNAFPHRNGFKRVVDLYTTWTLFKKNKKRTKHGKNVVISFRLRKP